MKYSSIITQVDRRLHKPPPKRGAPLVERGSKVASVRSFRVENRRTLRLYTSALRQKPCPKPRASQRDGAPALATKQLKRDAGGNAKVMLALNAGMRLACQSGGLADLARISKRAV